MLLKNDHKFSPLQPCVFITGPLFSVSQGVVKAVIAAGSQGPVLTSSGCWQSSVPWDYGKEDSPISGAVGQGVLSAPRADPQALDMWLSA